MTTFDPHIIAVIVTYNSGQELRTTLPAILAQVNGVVIVDNSTNDTTPALLNTLITDFSDITLIINHQNLGLGAAQNIGIRTAHKLGATFVLLLDDDSMPSDTMVKSLWHTYQHHPNPETIGLLSARIIDQHSGKRYPCLKMLSPYKVSRLNMDDHALMDGALLAMASGSLIKMDVLKKIGLMREDFIIDFIDWEFCFRLIKHGYTIVQVRDAVLHHQLGEQTNHRLFGRNWVTTNYPPFRRYTTARNRILFWRIFSFKLPIGLLVYQTMSIAYEALVILLFEKHKSKNLFAILRGLIVGLFRPIFTKHPPMLETINNNNHLPPH